MPVHINLTVADVDRSRAFYRRWLGFDGDERSFPDGTVFVRDAEGTDLAFHAGHTPTPPAPTVHFGFRRADPDAVRELHGLLVRTEINVLEFDDASEVVSVKFTDDDGYVIEVYWEP